MDFKKAAIISNYLSKDYAEKIFKLIFAYQNISASEAASRLNLHIRTVQDFLDTMAAYSIIDKKEVYEKKRPYNRYALLKKKIEIIIDLDTEFDPGNEGNQDFKLRESRRNSAKFSTARSGDYFSTITIWTGEGRATKERKINLTTAQGKFLYYLPFPDAEPLGIDEIMNKGSISEMNKPEILDIVKELYELRVIDQIDL